MTNKVFLFKSEENDVRSVFIEDERVVEAFKKFPIHIGKDFSENSVYLTTIGNCIKLFTDDPACVKAFQKDFPDCSFGYNPFQKHVSEEIRFNHDKLHEILKEIKDNLKAMGYKGQYLDLIEEYS